MLDAEIWSVDTFLTSATFQSGSCFASCRNRSGKVLSMCVERVTARVDIYLLQTQAGVHSFRSSVAHARCYTAPRDLPERLSCMSATNSVRLGGMLLKSDIAFSISFVDCVN